TVIDYRDSDRPGKVRGWDNGIQVLRSEGNREDIATRLTNELERLNTSGGLAEAAYRQAAGKAPIRLDPSVGRPDADRREADASGRGLPQDDRAKAFLTLPPEQAVKAHPELAPAYASLEAIKRQLDTSGLDAAQRSVVIDHAKTAAATRIAKNDIPSVDINESRQVERPADRER
ncbi:MAG: hypothetical protein ABIQ32_12720, partial [Sphingomicrobium sp.]